MKKVFLTVLVVAGFAAFAYAEHPKAEHPSVTAEEALVSASVASLTGNGVPAEKAETIVKDAVDAAKAEGLTGEELSAKVTAMVEEQIAAQNPEHAAAAAEHPSAGQPASEHPK